MSWPEPVILGWLGVETGVSYDCCNCCGAEVKYVLATVVCLSRASIQADSTPQVPVVLSGQHVTNSSGVFDFCCGY